MELPRTSLPPRFRFEKEERCRGVGLMPRRPGTAERLGESRRGTGTARHLPRLVDIETIADHLGVSVRHIRRLVAERRIPFVKWGNLLRFDPDIVAEWIDRRAVTPVDRNSRLRP